MQEELSPHAMLGTPYYHSVTTLSLKKDTSVFTKSLMKENYK